VQQAGGLIPARSRSASSPPPAPLDPAAAAVIEQELADTEPAERQGILNDLEGLSPNNMRAVLRAWKQSRQRRMPSEPLAAGPPPAAPPAGEPESTTSRLRRSLSAGLGSVSAWGTAIVGGRRGEPLAAPGVENEAAGVPAPAIPAPRGQIEAITPPPAESRPLPGNPAAVAARQGDPAAAARDPLQELIALTEAEVAELSPGPGQVEQDEYLSRHVALRMLYLVGGRHELALQVIPEIDPAEQEFWQHLFWGLANYFDTESLPASDERAAEAAAQLTDAVLKLQRRAALEIRFAALCDRIDGYGLYETRSAAEVTPGEAVLLYAELANVASVEEENGYHRASHANLIEILSQGGETDQVLAIELPVTEDRCRRQRRDYFASYAIELPPGLNPGPHVLRLTVTDQHSQRRAQYSVNFLLGEAPTATAPASVPSDPQPQNSPVDSPIDQAVDQPTVTRRVRSTGGPTDSDARTPRESATPAGDGLYKWTSREDRGRGRAPARVTTTDESIDEPHGQAPELPRARMSAKAPDREDHRGGDSTIETPVWNLEGPVDRDTGAVAPSSFEADAQSDEELDLPEEAPSAAPTPAPVHLPNFPEEGGAADLSPEVPADEESVGEESVEAEESDDRPATPEDESADEATAGSEGETADDPAMTEDGDEAADDDMPPLPPI